MIARILRKFRERRARKRLDQIVAQTRARPEIQQYAARRAASLKGWAKRRGARA